MAYELLLRRTLLRPALNADACAKCEMVTDEFDDAPETSVLLLRDGDNALVVARRAKTSLKQRLRSSWPKEVVATESDVQESRAPIPSADADLLEQIWEMMFNRMRQPSPTQGKAYFDTPTYRFAHCDPEYGIRSGRAVAPIGLNKELIAVGLALRDYATSTPERRESAHQELLLRAARLRKALIAHGQHPPRIKERRAMQSGRLVPEPTTGNSPP